MWRCCLAICFCVGILVACVPSDHKAKAKEGINRFHEHFNNNEFPRMYEAFDEQSRKNISLQRFTEEMNAMRIGQGAVLETTELSTEYHYLNGTSRVRMIVSVHYEKGDAREEFVFSTSNGKTEITGYRFLGP
jgi:hypothetical protein